MMWILISLCHDTCIDTSLFSQDPDDRFSANTASSLLILHKVSFHSKLYAVCEDYRSFPIPAVYILGPHHLHNWVIDKILADQFCAIVQLYRLVVESVVWYKHVLFRYHAGANETLPGTCFSYLCVNTVRFLVLRDNLLIPCLFNMRYDVDSDIFMSRYLYRYVVILSGPRW